MSLGTPAAQSLADRALELLTGSDAVVADRPVSTADLAALGPVLSTVETASDGGAPAAPADTVADLARPAEAIENAAVLGFHYELEATADQTGILVGPIHGLTGLGETVGLGHLGHPGNLLTDLVAVPDGVTAGTPLLAVAPLVGDAGRAAGAAGILAGTGVGEISGPLGAGGAVSQEASLANDIVLQTHAALEGTGHEIPVLNGPLHGLTNLGETVGLGHLGTGGNLLTDVANLPAEALSGHLAGGVGSVLSDLGNVTTAAEGLVGQVAGIASPGNGLTGTGGLLDPATGLVNAVAADLGSVVDGLGHEVTGLSGPAQGIAGLGEALGLGHVGDGGNLLTGVAALPGEILSGGSPSAGLAPVLAETGGVVGAAEGLVHQLTGAASPGAGIIGSGGVLAPVTSLANTAVLDVHASIEGIGHEVPVLNGPVHALTNLGETAGLGHVGEPGNLVTDATTLPSQVLAGNAAGAAEGILGDAGDTATAAGGLVQSVVDSGRGSNLLDTVTHALGGTPLGGDPVGGLLSGSGSAPGAQPLVSLEAGQVTANPLAVAAILAPIDPAPHAVDVGAGTAPAGQPPAIQIGALTGDSISVPSLGGAGQDELIGKALDLAPAAATHDLAAAAPDHGLVHEVAGLDFLHIAAVPADPAHGALHGLI